jgi:hypothetical protein
MRETAKFRCPGCTAEYLIMRVEAAPGYDKQMLCASCGGPLQSRVGKFALKYFRQAASGANHRNGNSYHPHGVSRKS